LYARVIGFALNGRRCQRKLKPAVQFSGHGVFAGPRVDFDCKCCTGGRVADFNHRDAVLLARRCRGHYNTLVMASLPETDPIRDLLQRAKTIAVVGLSDSPLRPSHGVSAYMQIHGYHIIPVNPKITEALGEKSYPTLLDIPGKIDIVNIFRRPDRVQEIVEQAIQRKVPAIWMQEDVINEAAAGKARQAGIFVVMDRCILKEHKLRLG
jgi:predicted CoA-binding protein